MSFLTIVTVSLLSSATRCLSNQCPDSLSKRLLGNCFHMIYCIKQAVFTFQFRLDEFVSFSNLFTVHKVNISVKQPILRDLQGNPW